MKTNMITKRRRPLTHIDVRKLKRCKQCNIALPADEETFGWANKEKTVLNTTCRLCLSLRQSAKAAGNQASWDYVLVAEVLPMCPICIIRKWSEWHHFMEKTHGDPNKSVRGLMQRYFITSENAPLVIEQLKDSLPVCSTCHKALDPRSGDFNGGRTVEEMEVMQKIAMTTIGRATLHSKIERMRNGEGIYYDHGKGYDL